MVAWSGPSSFSPSFSASTAKGSASAYRPCASSALYWLSASIKAALSLAEAFGPNDPRLGGTLYALALLYNTQGRYAEAEPLYKRALAIWEKALGPDHPNVATTLENYAAVLRKTGRTTEAVKLEARAKAIRAKHAK